MHECKPLARGGGRGGGGGGGLDAAVKHAVATAESMIIKGDRWGVGGHGRPVQVDPIEPTLKAPGTYRLKL